MKTRFKRVAAAMALMLAVAGISVFGIQQPASASADSVYCDYGYLCLFEHVNGGGSILEYGNNSGSCVNVPWNWNDKISSVRNDLSYTIRLYWDAYCTPSWGYITITSHSGWNDLHAFGFGDNITSIAFY